MVLTENRAEKDWARIDRYLKFEIPLATIPHINVYPCPIRVQHSDEIEKYSDRTSHLKELIERSCTARLTHYKRPLPATD